MGVGTPVDIAEAVLRGVDMFDCVIPTRHARNGQLFTSRGNVKFRHARYADDTSPPDPDCGCYTCQNYSLSRTCGTSRNATRCLGPRLATMHNLFIISGLWRDIRERSAPERWPTVHDEPCALYACIRLTTVSTPGLACDYFVASPRPKLCAIIPRCFFGADLQRALQPEESIPWNS